MWAKNRIRSPYNSEIAVYDSFFTPAECGEIYDELLETIEQSRMQTNGVLPWTNILLDIKQFVEDRLNLEFNTATLTECHQMITGTLQNGSLLLVQGEIVVGYFYRLVGPLEHPPIVVITLF